MTKNPYRKGNTAVAAAPKRTASSDNNKKTLISTELQGLLSKLRPFQREAYEFATLGKVSSRLQPSSDFRHDPDLLGKGRILLADEMGLGKTITSLAIMAHYKSEWPLLILCPASLRHMWPAEIEKFLPSIPPQAVYVVNGFNDIHFEKKPNVQVVVVTFSLLQNRSAVAQLLQTFHFRCIIVDESHNLKQKTAQRSKLALPILKEAQRLVLLSGTPAMARPVELWLQLHVLSPTLFGKYTDFTNTYCGAKRIFGRWDVSGLSNAKELHAKLQQVMVRRLKCNVLHELPPKQRSVIPIHTIADKTKLKETQQLLQELKGTRLSVAQLVGDDQRTASFEAKTLFQQAYQAGGMIKAQAVADYLVDWIAGAGTQKVLVFCHHKAVMDTLELAISKSLKGVGHIRIDGSVASNERAKLVRKFQTSVQVRVALLSMTAAGVGLTLTAASNVMFAELHYTPGVLAQAEDRAHRIGQRNAVNIMYFICKDPTISVDLQLWNMLGRKVGTLEQVIEGGTGKERAALAAVEQEEQQPRQQSAQEELTTFFAETAAAEAKAPPKVATKGSILSFFQKKKASNEVSAATTNNNSVAASKPQAVRRPEKKKQLPTRSCSFDENQEASPTRSVPEKTKKDDKVEWACQACTFVNCKKAASVMACHICQTVFDHKKEASSVKSAKQSQRPKKQSTPSRNASPLALQVPMSSKPSSSPDVIVLDDDDAGAKPTATKSHKKRKDRPDVVVIDVDTKQEPAKKPKKSSIATISTAASPAEMLTFSVSKNSGRFTLHYNETNTSTFQNFAADDVLTEKTVIALEDAQTKRGKSTDPTCIAFNQLSVMEIIQRLDSSIVSSPPKQQQCARETEEFVRSYLALREVHRKAIKDSGEAFSSKNLAQSAAKLLTMKNTSALHKSSTDRYSGGAKERAGERLKDGTASKEDMDVLKGDNCAWCAGALSDASKLAKAVYCSQACAEEGRIRRGGMFASSRIREQVFALEGGVCQLCGVNAHALFLRIKSLPPSERLSVLCNAKWKLPKSRRALERLLQDPTEGSFWQADHIQAVAEGGGGCGIDNLRSLCVPCHTIETEKLRGRLKLNGGSGLSQDDGVESRAGKLKQMDIRDVFTR
ncbi:annealing helicase and endonuclease ZRANB3 [Seminavis robusta]|uniref:Annealing helicase and endonuclease ZRANB3 n=1 Tax=Seminavis robusta TaxID=568900 RepID=A0A9N8H3F9_9STRA|nr:annealing helicase and endonuclease ZRANB3 [Seminavis robusta]|eukprot:Sro59_g034290.1 annealing helicase and endonuclease ZRANB3 (1114) ;mRNA; r:111050-114391